MPRAPSVRSRAAELRRRLESAGLPVQRRRVVARPGQDLAAAACRTLRSLGPLYAAFSGYLGGRLDLVPLRHALQLAAAPEGLPPSPAEAVGELLQRTGWGVEGAPALDPAPVRTTAVHQWHRAWDGDGRALWVQLVRPELERQLERDWSLVHEVAVRRLWDGGETPVEPEELTEGFASWLQDQLDLGAASGALEPVREAAAAHGEIDVAVPEPGWSGPRVAVTRLEDAEPLPGGDDDTDLARRLAFAWLHLALLGGLCLHDLDRAEWATRPGARLGLLGGRVRALDRPSRQLLLGALVAASQHEPDRSADLLRRMSEVVDDDASLDHLRVSLRQAEPFRAAGWGDHYAGERFADVLFVHWRTARAVGFRPGPPLLAFQRGLAGLDRVTRTMAPERDVLDQAMADLRVVAAAVEVRRAVAPSRAPNLVTRWLAAVEAVAHHGDGLGGEEANDPPSPETGRTTRGWLAPLAVAAVVATAGAALGAPLTGVSTVALLGAVVWFAVAVERDIARRPARTPPPAVGRTATGGRA